MAKTRQYAAENNIQRPIAVAICLTEQLVQSVPIDDTDIKPDQIIHE